MQIRVLDSVRGRALFTRSTARELEDIIREGLEGSPNIELDFSGAKAISPSFFDELLWVIEEASIGPTFRVLIRNAPEPLDRKFNAVAAGHKLRITGDESGTWILTSTQAA